MTLEFSKVTSILAIIPVKSGSAERLLSCCEQYGQDNINISDNATGEIAFFGKFLILVDRVDC